MKKRTTLIALGIILSSQILPLAAHASTAVSETNKGTSSLSSDNLSSSVLDDVLNSPTETEEPETNTTTSKEEETTDEAPTDANTSVSPTAGIAPAASEEERQWGGATVYYNTATGVLRVPSGSHLQDPGQLAFAPIRINFEGPVTVTGNVEYMFYNTTARGLEYLDVSGLADMTRMFRGSTIVDLPPLRDWDTSNVTNMLETFSGCRSLTSLEGLNNWDTSNVTDMAYTFMSCSSLASLKGLEKWDTSNVTDMTNTFASCKSLTNLEGLENWDTKNVRLMGNESRGDSRGTFSSCTSLTDVTALKDWNVGKVESMDSMFIHVPIKSCDFSNWNTKNVKTMASMFGAENISAVDATQAPYSLDGIENWDVRNVEDFTAMFAHTNLERLDLSGWEMESTISVGAMFRTIDKTDVNLKEITLAPQKWITLPFSNTSFSSNPIEETNVYTGKWQNVGSGTPMDPEGTNVWTAREFNDNYNWVLDADTYVWQKKVKAVDIPIYYVDESGQTLLPSKKTAGNTGTTYTTTAPTVPGYHLTAMPDNASGKYKFEEQSITYVYAKNVDGADVTVNYVDEKGLDIIAPIRLTGTVDDSYKAEQKEFEGYTYLKTTGNPEGTFTEKAQTVTFVYQENAMGGNVTVKYVDTNGERILDDVILSGKVGVSYETEQKEIEGCVFEKVEGPASGKFTENAQTVTYIYKANAWGGDVTVRYVEYVNDEFVPLTDDTVLKGRIGMAYTTEQKSFEGYTFLQILNRLPASGEFTEQPQTITYAYTANAMGKDVTVQYVDTDGKEIASEEVLSDRIGVSYQTESKSIPGYSLTEVPANATGSFSAEEQTVTYVYDLSAMGGKVTAKYEDTDGEIIAANVVAQDRIGLDYTTEALDIPGYTLKEIHGVASGQYTADAQTVTYIYTANPIGGDVTVKYVDEDGKEIADAIVLSDRIGLGYTTEEKAIKGYTFKAVTGNASGSFTNKAQTVTYVYDTNPVGGDVTVNYVDEDGKAIAEEVVLSDRIGLDYSTEKKTIKGYTFQTVDGNASGSFTDKAQTVTYIYKANAIGGNVTVQYVDEAGKAIAEEVVLSGPIEQDYTTEKKVIKGYSFKEVTGDASGSFTNKAQTVTYVYKANPIGGDVTVQYVDEAGKAIADAIVLSGPIEQDYTTEEKAIEGYTFKGITGNATGSFTDKAQTVTYVYSENAMGGDVTVKYVDESGSAVASTEVLKGRVGVSYSSTAKAIEGYSLKATPDNASGKFTETAQTITYVYALNPIGGNVTVKYVDTNGKALSADLVLSDRIGVKYKTEAKEFAGYSLQATQGNPSGSFTEAAQTITYVYELNGIGGNITVKYVDTNGESIAPNMILSDRIGQEYKTEALDIPGYTLKEINGIENGKFTEKTQTVTYVYSANVMGANVTVKYVDENGKAIADDEILKDKVGVSYTTTEKTIKDYVLLRVEGETTGFFSNQAQTVTYVYTDTPVQAGNVTVQHVDTAGNAIASDQVLSGYVGARYTTETVAIGGYSFKEVKGNATGLFTGQAQTVTYVYAANAMSAGVTVQYVNENGTRIADDEVLTDRVGVAYATVQKSIKDYYFLRVEGEATGHFSDQAKTVTYVYTKTPVQAGNVTVHHVDTSGQSLYDDVILSGYVGASYTTEAVAIGGYSFKEVKGNATGLFTSGAQSVTYVYSPNPLGGNVTAKYVDTAGKVIATEVVSSGRIGMTYTTEQKTISGYRFKELKGSATGEFNANEQIITYVYTKSADQLEAVGVYRLYNKASMEHLYTTDLNEYNSLPKLSKDWVQEGVNFKAYKKSDATTVTVNRVYNPKSGEHLFTTDSNEVKVLTSKHGWKSENVAFYTPKTSNKPVYRLFNAKAGVGAHFYTADAYEKNVLTTKPKEWLYEGVAWYAVD